MQNRNVLKLFPQPLIHYKFEDFKEQNKELEKYIKNLYQRDTDGLQRSNIDGWHSPDFSLKEKDSAAYKFFTSLRKYLVDVFKILGWQYDPNKIIITNMWAIINKKNNFNLPHIHPNCYLSAAYYVKTHDGCGKIKFTNPNLASRQRSPLIENKTDFNQNGIEIDPKEGDLLFFPAYLTHEVLRNNSNEERIVISFNIDITR
tara:strand:+ start:283 stop:888 length:606 start_codon:yes stop_codon:yes gene_type:complete